MARNETNAIDAQSLAGSTVPKAARAAYQKPELECLGIEGTELGSPGGGSDATFPAFSAS